VIEEQVALGISNEIGDGSGKLGIRDSYPVDRIRHAGISLLENDMVGDVVSVPDGTVASSGLFHRSGGLSYAANAESWTVSAI
jgi:hypothetical protein